MTNEQRTQAFKDFLTAKYKVVVDETQQVTRSYHTFLICPYTKTDHVAQIDVDYKNRVMDAIILDLGGLKVSAQFEIKNFKKLQTFLGKYAII
jgi:hypothetical protein